MSITWLFAPFLFNPAGFDWEKIVDDWKNLNKWIRLPGGIGIQQDKSWQSWWNDEQAHLCGSGLGARLFEILLSARFFMYQYGLVYHLDISQKSKNVLVYILSWFVILAVFLLVKVNNSLIVLYLFTCVSGSLVWIHAFQLYYMINMQLCA
jgi:callose synthase